MRLLLAILLICALSAGAADNTDEPKSHHDGSIKDVSAIGNRNVGCGRGVGNWYSLDKQVAMGKQYSQQIESQVKLINDPVISKRLLEEGAEIRVMSPAEFGSFMRAENTRWVKVVKDAGIQPQ